jgi:hypothetical protein
VQRYCAGTDGYIRSMSRYHQTMRHIVYKVETEIEKHGRWIAEIPELPGAAIILFAIISRGLIRRIFAGRC